MCASTRLFSPSTMYYKAQLSSMPDKTFCNNTAFTIRKSLKNNSIGVTNHACYCINKLWQKLLRALPVSLNKCKRGF